MFFLSLRIGCKGFCINHRHGHFFTFIRAKVTDERLFEHGQGIIRRKITLVSLGAAIKNPAHLCQFLGDNRIADTGFPKPRRDFVQCRIEQGLCQFARIAPRAPHLTNGQNQMKDQHFKTSVQRVGNSPFDMKHVLARLRHNSAIKAVCKGSSGPGFAPDAKHGSSTVYWQFADQYGKDFRRATRQTDFGGRSMNTQSRRVSFLANRWALPVALASALALSACQTQNVISHGYQVDEQTLALVPEGSSRDQVLLSLGTPSTTNQNTDGTETMYYISQTKKRPVAFMQPKVVEQRVLAIYLNQESTVERIANYGLKEGKVFDFIRRVTPTGGRELSFLTQLLGAAGAVATPLGRAGPSNDRGF